MLKLERAKSLKECTTLGTGAAASGGPRAQLLHDIDWPVRGAAAIRVGDYKLIRLPAEAGVVVRAGTRLSFNLFLLLRALADSIYVSVMYFKTNGQNPQVEPPI
jgi:hypothetical protein